ncbi:MAG TPA: FAD-binding oxidoreductase [Devosia sp.]|nr:FAD-binding oxidoreductase [Devosia sp.]
MSAVQTAIAALKGLKGKLILPSDADYDAARKVMYGGFDPRPAVIVRVADAADIQRAVTAARDNGVELAVRSGGHSNAGHGSSEGGIVIDLRDMKAIAMDAAAGTLTAETGAIALDVTRAAGEHGKVVGFGDAGTVGVGGITLGGGVGYMARKYGLSIDSLLNAEIVTADGRLLTIDATHEPDLFWAIRGGGGNFGVVTRLTYRLSPLPEFAGGMMALPATPETLAGFMAAARNASENLSTIANVMPCPPMPFVPAEVHGKPVILAMLAYSGPAAEAEDALKPFRELATPYADFVKAGDYAQLMYPPEDPDYHPTAVARTMFMNCVGIDEAKLIIDEITRSDATFSVVQLRELGGAVARVAPDATAYAHRRAPIMVNVAAFYTDAADKLKREAWIADFGGRLEQEEKGAYVNFLGLDGPQRIDAAYPGKTLERLRQVKKRYDPQNLFHRNQNIAPAT